MDPWIIIDTYFRDTKYYKSQHHIDSYNDLLSDNNNSIQHIIKRDNPIKVFKDDYEIDIYFGEILDKSGKILVGEGNINISKPLINKNRYMYPNDARLRKFNI